MFWPMFRYWRFLETDYKDNKKAYTEKECIDFIKTKKLCKIQWKGTKKNNLCKW